MALAKIINLINHRIKKDPSAKLIMPARDAHYQSRYTVLLKNLCKFLEAQYGLTITGDPSSMPAPPENSSIAHHFAAYLAISGIISWIYEIPDSNTGKPVLLFVTKPQKTDIVQGFRAMQLRDWMKDVPELNKLYLKAIKNPEGFFLSNKCTPIPWHQQLSHGVQTFKNAVDLAGNLAAHEHVILTQPDALSPEEADARNFDLFTAYRSMPGSTSDPTI